MNNKIKNIFPILFMTLTSCGDTLNCDNESVKKDVIKLIFAESKLWMESAIMPASLGNIKMLSHDNEIASYSCSATISLYQGDNEHEVSTVFYKLERLEDTDEISSDETDIILLSNSNEIIGKAIEINNNVHELLLKNMAESLKETRKSSGY